MLDHTSRAPQCESTVSPESVSRSASASAFGFGFGSVCSSKLLSIVFVSIAVLGWAA